jgi:hypothetical protein
MRKLLLLLLVPFSVMSQQGKMELSRSAPAVSFIQSLSKAQQYYTALPFSELNRFSWHYVPTYMYPRDGIAVKDLDADQAKKLDELLQSYLSKEGYKKVMDIMSFEYILRELEPDNPTRIPGNYKIAFYGKPEKDSIWGWKFTGHHIALNFTIIDDKLAFAPLFFGANPGIVQSGPQKGFQLFKTEEELGYKLLSSLSPDQEKQAIIQVIAFDDIITTNSVKVSPLAPVGIEEKNLTAAQKDLLNQLILAYLYPMPPYIAKARMDRVASEDKGSIRFGWAGSKEQGKGHYYRIQGKTFLIELDNTQNNANHVHVVWRDFDGDYGQDLIREHYHSEPHSTH